LLALEGLHDSLLIVIVDLDGLDTFRDGAFALLTDESGDSMFARLEKLFGEGAADTTVDLSRLTGRPERIKVFDLRQ
jgi:hypothetical protein